MHSWVVVSSACFLSNKGGGVAAFLTLWEERERHQRSWLQDQVPEVFAHGLVYGLLLSWGGAHDLWESAMNVREQLSLYLLLELSSNR